MDITVERAAQLKPKPQDENKLGFGKIFTDHMFIMDYHIDKGWYNPRIVPYAPLTLDPATTCLHYGQLIFEGLKAYRAQDDKIVLFRPKKNMERMNKSADRLCIANIDEDTAVQAVAELVKLERDWIPAMEGTSLYVRPFIISTDAFLGVHPSETYQFMVILSPVGPYYPEGLAPVRIYVEENFVRSVAGGTGFTKCAGNYAASLAGQVKAEAEGYSQVLWLDGREGKYIDEVGSMNVFFVVDGTVITPELNGAILGGVTRDSVIHLLKDWGIPVEERKVSIDEIAEAHKAGKLQEAFGTGTAAVVSPIGLLKAGDNAMQINENKIGSISQRLYDEITGIQRGTRPDKYGWIYEIS